MKELTLELLETGYQNCTFGYWEPTHHVQDLLKAVNSPDISVFNSAVLVEATDACCEVLHFVNINCLNGKRGKDFQAWLDLKEMKWVRGHGYCKRDFKSEIIGGYYAAPAVVT